MSFLETFVDEIESRERAEDMHFSTYYIPPEYQPLEDSPQ